MAGSKSMGSPLSCIAQMLRKVGTGQLLLTSAELLLAAVLLVFPLLPPPAACLSARRGRGSLCSDPASPYTLHHQARGRKQ